MPAQVKPVQREESGTSHPPSETEIKRREETGLLPGLTFENYVNGNANQLAVAAAEHVATTTGTQYNPLYIYGGVGLGKTHLMQAIGHRYLDLHPKARVRCVSAQDFINEYTSAVRESTNKTHASLENLMNDIVVSTCFSLTTYSLCLEQRDHKGSSSELLKH